MNNYSKLTFKIQSKITKLVKFFDQDLTKPQTKFFTDMITGTLSSKSVLISKISRSICTKTESVKHVNKRLSRNIDHHINDDTIFCVDNSDITKILNTVNLNISTQ